MILLSNGVILFLGKYVYFSFYNGGFIIQVRALMVLFIVITSLICGVLIICIIFASIYLNDKS